MVSIDEAGREQLLRQIRAAVDDERAPRRLRSFSAATSSSDRSTLVFAQPGSGRVSVDETTYFGIAL